MRSRTAVAGFAVAASLAGAAFTAPDSPAAFGFDRPWYATADGAADTPTRGVAGGRSVFSRAVGPSDPSGLPAAQENVDVVSRFSPTHPDFGAVQLGQIADLAVHDGYAYLNSWDDPDCKRGGTFVVDIRDAANPKQIGFIKPKYPYYHGEGAHAISVDIPSFKGDILAVNNETYGSNVPLNDVPECDFDDDPNTPNDTSGGGFDLYDVSDPANPKVLVQGAGDKDAGTPDDPADDTDFANSYHSVYVWQAGPRMYLVASDNVELTDVDIFDITNPAAPVEVADLDLVEEFPQILDGEDANGSLVLHHDMVVKQINGRFILKSDYWDAGYVQLDVTDPANPTYVTDTRFSGEDPLRPGSGLTAEGNAHQGEFSSDNQFLLTGDEDFGVARLTARATSGPTDGNAATVAEGDAVALIADLPDGVMNGSSLFVGDACDPATIPNAPADDGDPNTEDIALVERGGVLPDTSSCGFANKFDNVEAAGWDALLIFNQVRPDDGQVNMLTGEGGIPGVQMRRVDAFGAEGVLGAGPATPAIGTAGPDLEVTSEFDGWGYAHLYDAKTSALLDSYAIPEGQDSRYAAGFGDLTIHEFAADPTTNLAYASWYAGGMRIFRFSRANGLEPVGKYIADGGSNFWGVEQFTAPNGERLIAGSDRDFGLVVLRYTGPGAVGPTPPAPPPVPLPQPAPEPGDYYYQPPPASNNGFTVGIGKYKKGKIRLTVKVKKNGRFTASAFGKVLRKATSKKKRTTKLASRSLRLTGLKGTYRVVVKLDRKHRKMVKRTRAKKAVKAKFKFKWDPSPGPASRKKGTLRIPKR